MNQQSLTNQIIERTEYLRVCEISENVIHFAKRCLVDYCGVVLAGANVSENKVKKYFSQIVLNGTSGNTSVYGLGLKTDVYTAALINGINAHLIELDDGHRFGMMHMGAPVISALLAFAENRNLDGERLLRGIICAYDVSIALARQMQPGHKLKGYHATGTCCTVGAAVGIALLMNQNKEQIRGTISAAATSAAGLLEVIDDASELKPYNIGRAAMDAVAAAMTGFSGFKGPDDAIGGKRGFFAALAPAENYEKIKENCVLFNKENYAITEIYTKPYAACRHCHPAIEGALKVREQLMAENVEITANNVKRITVQTYKLAIEGHNHTTIHNVSSAKMSTPYAATVALLTGRGGMSAYNDDMLQNTEVQKLMERFTVVLSDELNQLAPKKRAAIVEVELTDGRRFNCRVDYPLGEPENPMSDQVLEDKMTELAMLGGKNADTIQNIIQIIRNYEEQANALFEKLQ